MEENTSDSNSAVTVAEALSLPETCKSRIKCPNSKIKVETILAHEDWTDFRAPDSLCRRAGVDREKLGRAVIKELVDNALDKAGSCKFGRASEGRVFVSDDGDGIPGTDDDIALLFSIRRPRMSSKTVRRPSRGALGNGLRVVAGSQFAWGTDIVVSTRGRTLTLRPRDTGDVEIVERQECDNDGTRIEIGLWPEALNDEDVFEWAYEARMATNGGKTYKG